MAVSSSNSLGLLGDSEATTPALPPLARVAVIVGSQQIDVVVPSGMPLRTVMDDLVETIGRTATAHDFRLPAGMAWTLSRIGADPIPRARTLDEEGITDGELLILRKVRGGERYTPLVEEVSEAVARFNDMKFADFTAATAYRCGLAGIIATAVAAASMLWVSWVHASWPWWIPLAAAVLGLACWAAAVSGGARRGQITPPRYALAVASWPLLFCAGGTAVPALEVPRGLGGPQVVLGCVALAIAAGGFGWLTRTAVMASTAAVTFAVLLGAGGLAVGYLPMNPHAVAAAMVVVSMLLLTNLAKITIVLSRVRPPNLPPPGDPVREDTLNEAFRPDLDDTGLAAVEANDRLERRARAANKYLTGLVVAVTVCLSGASIVAIEPHTFHALPAGILAAVISGVLFLRARSYIDRAQSIVLYLGFVVTGIGAGVVVCWSYSAAGTQMVVFACVLIGAAIAIAAALKGPGSQLSPVTRRMVEILEYILICASYPLALWVTGLYGLLRGL